MKENTQQISNLVLLADITQEFPSTVIYKISEVWRSIAPYILSQQRPWKYFFTNL